MKLRMGENPWYIVGVFIFLALCFAMAGTFFYISEKEKLKQDKHNELTAISNLKVWLIQNWLQERMNDGHSVTDNHLLGIEFRNWLVNIDGQLFPFLFRHAAKALNKGDNYSDIILADRSGSVRMAVGKTRGCTGPETKKFISESAKKQAVVFSDFYVCGHDKKIVLDIIAPLTEYHGVNTDSPGFVILRIDPFHFIYKLIQFWPVPSRTAETLLVRKEGEEVVYLNELRHRVDTALKLRLPASMGQLPAARAVRDMEGMTEGTDYRNVEVLADIRRISGTPWFIVVKVDIDEIYAPLRTLLAGTLILVIALTGLSGFGTAWWWSRQRMHFHQKQNAAETRYRVLEKQFDFLYRYAHDIILLVDGDLKIMQANERAVETYGYTQDELKSITLKEIRAPEYVADLIHQYKNAEIMDGMTFETFHRKKDGTVFPVETSARIISIEGKKYIQSIIRDISERKCAEHTILKLNQTYLMQSRINQAISHIRDRNELLHEACRIAVENGTYAMAWVGIVNEQTGMVDPVAWHGISAEEYLKDIRISTRDVPEGRGPTGSAMRERKNFICQDIEGDDHMRPWRDKALGSGYRSSAAFPVIVHNAVVGIFSLYAPEPFFFSKEEVRLIEDMISEIAYGIEFIEHVSEREKAEERVRTLNAELEERVMLRTAQLDAANKELEAFSYSVSHDLKAPLRAIEGFSKIVVEENAETLDQETRRLLNLVRDNARRMGNLIDDLLSFSRAGRHALSIQRIGMESLVDSVWQELVSREPGRTFEFAVEQLPDAEGDQPLIRQVWANLISNAIKFTSPRDVGIISVGSRAGNESVVYFVKDNGVGFDMQYADKLFGVFQRLHSQGEFQGTGVGLALVHRIIQRHGGKVWAEGAVDGGATFFFSLNSTPDGHDTDNCHAGIVSQGAPAAKQQ